MTRLLMALAAATSMAVAGLAGAQGAVQAVAPAPASAPMTDTQVLRDALRTDKRAFVAKTLALTPAQDKKFWPVYDTYQRALDMVARARAITAETLLSRDKKLSNAEAKMIVSQNTQADDNEQRARRRMVKGAMAALPAITAARYIQLESKFRAVQAYDIAQAFPLIQ